MSLCLVERWGRKEIVVWITERCKETCSGHSPREVLHFIVRAYLPGVAGIRLLVGTISHRKVKFCVGILSPKKGKSSSQCLVLPVLTVVLTVKARVCVQTGLWTKCMADFLRYELIAVMMVHYTNSLNPALKHKHFSLVSKSFSKVLRLLLRYWELQDEISEVILQYRKRLIELLKLRDSCGSYKTCKVPECLLTQTYTSQIPENLSAIVWSTI